VAAVPAPIQRAGGPRLKVGLNAYSFSDLLLENLKDKSKGLDLFQLCDYCAQHDFEAIDPTGYFFRGYPEIPDDAYLHAFKRHAFDRGLAISGTGVRNDFTAADPVVRAEGVQRVKAWVEVAAKLGAPVVRVFADCQAPFKTWQAASNNASRVAVETWMATAMQECAEHGAKYGVIIGVQNHGDFIATGEQHLSLLSRINHRWCGAIVDTGKYVTADPYQDIAQVAPVAVNWQVKESPFGRADRPATDWKKLAGILRQSGYRGYVPIETLAMNRKDYDPYKLAAQVQRELQSALNAS
jgi:sugar phosphate isomerase/epimerase